MTPAEAIEAALQRGVDGGIEALDATERSVLLISEAETFCDMEGIESFLDRYSESLREAAHVFAQVSAAEIADSLRAIHASLPEWPESLLARANTLITSRTGYDSDAVYRLLTPTA